MMWHVAAHASHYHQSLSINVGGPSGCTSQTHVVRLALLLWRWPVTPFATRLLAGAPACACALATDPDIVISVQADVSKMFEAGKEENQAVRSKEQEAQAKGPIAKRQQQQLETKRRAEEETRKREEAIGKVRAAGLLLLCSSSGGSSGGGGGGSSGSGAAAALAAHAHTPPVQHSQHS